MFCFKQSLKGSLDRLVFASELEFRKILVSRLLQHSLNVNTGCAGRYLHFIILILICFLLIMPAVNYVIDGRSSSKTTPGIITIQELHTGGRTLLQLSLKKDER